MVGSWHLKLSGISYFLRLSKKSSCRRCQEDLDIGPQKLCPGVPEIPIAPFRRKSFNCALTPAKALS